MADQSSPRKKTYELTARSIFYAMRRAGTTSRTRALPPTWILRDVSFTARPGELLAIVGPSGTGKSILLDILATRRAPTYGSLLLNSSPLHHSTFRKLSAYASPRHEVYHPALTVAETFLFAAALRTDFSRTDVNSLLEKLRLSHVAQRQLSRKLSSGERRRVSIGLVLLRKPAVLLLDEPTSSLDSYTAGIVMNVLRSEAKSLHTTVVLSIHQPSAKIISFIDSLLLLSKGTVLHLGDISSLDAFLSLSGFPVPPDLKPLEYAMEVLDRLPQPTTALAEPPISPTPPSPSPPLLRQEIRYTSSRLHEVFTVQRRYWKILYRNQQLLLNNTIKSLAVGFLLGTIYIKMGYGNRGIRKRQGLFGSTLTFLLSSTTETLPIFAGKRSIVLREASSGAYRLSSYILAVNLVFLPYLFVISLLYSASVYFPAGLCASWRAFAGFVLIVWTVVLTVNSFVLFVRSVAPLSLGRTWKFTVSLLNFFFSGYYIAKGDMPAHWLFMHYLSPYKYGLDAFHANEYGCAAGRCFGRADDGACAVTGRDVLAELELREGQHWAYLQVLLGFSVFFLMLYWLDLIRQVSRYKR